MNVLFIGPLPDPMTGHALACRVLLDALLPLHKVTVINLSKPELTHGFTSTSHVFAVFKVLVNVWRERASADIVYLTIAESVAGNIKDLAIYFLCRRKLSRMIVHLHGGSLRAWIFDKYALLRKLNRYFLSRVGAIVVLGASHARIFAGVAEDRRVHVIPNFAEDHVFSSEQRIFAKFEERAPIRVLFLSNLINGKGHDEMVEAYLALDEAQRARLTLDFAGAFESPASQKKFLSAIAGHPNIRYHGVVSGKQKRQLLEQTHALCLPTSLLEGQPISILEAYAAGCIVLATDRGGIRDIFRDAVNGLQIATPEAASLRRVFETLLVSREQLLPMALTNFRTAQSNFRAARFTRDLLNLMDRLHEQSL